MNKFIRFLFLLGVTTLTLLGCNSAVGVNDPSDGKSGSLTVTIADSISRSILPGISMTPASYVVEGAGPNNETFSTTVTGANSATINDLAFGAWSVTVTAKNSGGVAIGAGTGTTTVISNASASVAVTVKHYDGFGTLSLGLTWPAADVQTPGVIATLLPTTGTARTLDFTVDGTAGTASATATNVATGYHTLSLKLQDNGKTVMGAVEVVRIVKDQTTSGSIAFTNVNKATGSIAVNISTDMSDPLTVAIAGSATTKPANQTLNLSASVSNYTDNVTYVWYVNGDSVETGTSFAFDNTWAKGYYRIDVTAFSADGKRAGSATTTLQVVDAVTGNKNYTSANIGTLVFVPAGSFQRDSTATNVSVITQPFRMSATEITRDQFLSIMGTDPSYTISSSGTTDPVQKINWYHAIAFCNKLSLAEGLTPVYSVTVGGTPVNWSNLTYATIPTIDSADWNVVNADWNADGYRLPTEMEWMWAAMGADTANPGSINVAGYSKAFSGSTGSNAIGDYAWYDIINGTTTQAVGTKMANELGLYDMSGNVWEWVWDWYAVYPTGKVTDYRTALGSRRALRGGSWGYTSDSCAVAGRSHTYPYFQGTVNGFRVVRR